LIASTAALLSNVRTEKLMLKRDGYIMLFSSFLLFVFILDHEISRVEALFFLLLYVAYLLFLLDKIKKHEEDMYFKDFLIYFLRLEYLFDLKVRIKTRVLEQRAKSRAHEFINEDRGAAGDSIENESSLSMEIFKIVGSVAAIIIGANYLVEQAILFAQLLEVPETLIGLSLIAVGTSIPELMVTLSASYRGYAGIAVGNVIGSNITNILLILGCSGLVNPLIIGRLSAYYIAPFLLILSSLFLLFIRTGWRIKKFEGLMLLLLYSGFMILIFHLG
jgi:cation:H+ antiporter